MPFNGGNTVGLCGKNVVLFVQFVAQLFCKSVNGAPDGGGFVAQLLLDACLAFFQPINLRQHLSDLHTEGIQMLFDEASPLLRCGLLLRLLGRLPPGVKSAAIRGHGYTPPAAVSAAPMAARSSGGKPYSGK